MPRSNSSSGVGNGRPPRFPRALGSRAPKPPGRKPGAGTFRYREAPPPEAVTEPPVDVKVILESCPACGGPLAEERVDLAYRTELPERPRRKVTPVPRVGLSVHRLRHTGARPAPGPGAGPIRRHRPPPGGTGDGRGACVALRRGDPGAEGPSRVGGIDGGAADAGGPYAGCPATRPGPSRQGLRGVAGRRAGGAGGAHG